MSVLPISTHVLDSSRGEAVENCTVSLHKLIDGRWTYLTEAVTSGKGRIEHFICERAFTTGRFKLHFDVEKYHQSKDEGHFFPFIEVHITNIM